METPSEEKHLLDKAREKIGDLVSTSHLPTQDRLGYISTVGIYGWKLTTDPDGKMVCDNRSVIAQLDQKGDYLLRRTDEHVIKEPGKLFWRHPHWFLKQIFTPPKRYRGNKEEVAANATKLGLEGYYSFHPWGIEIKKPEVYYSGRSLQDIYRADLLQASSLEGLDRFQALTEAAKYVRQIHNQFGAIGELLSNDIIFQKREGDLAIDPILNMPDIVYDPHLKTGIKEQKATDILDFLNHVGAEEWRRSGDWKTINQTLETIINNYGDREIIRAVASLAKRGRLVLPQNNTEIQTPLTLTDRLHGIFIQHNRRRLSAQEEFAGHLRQEIIKVSKEFLTPSNSI